MNWLKFRKVKPYPTLTTWYLLKVVHALAGRQIRTCSGIAMTVASLCLLVVIPRKTCCKVDTSLLAGVQIIESSEQLDATFDVSTMID